MPPGASTVSFMLKTTSLLPYCTHPSVGSAGHSCASSPAAEDSRPHPTLRIMLPFATGIHAVRFTSQYTASSVKMAPFFTLRTQIGALDPWAREQIQRDLKIHTQDASQHNQALALRLSREPDTALDIQCWASRQDQKSRKINWE